MKRRVSIPVMMPGPGGVMYAEENLQEAAKAAGLDMTDSNLEKMVEDMDLQVQYGGDTARTPQTARHEEEEESEDEGDVSVDMSAQGGTTANGMKTGWLKKEGGKRKTVKRRWFTLDPVGRVLMYAKDSKSSMLGGIPLLDVGVLPVGKKKHGFAFQLFSLSGGLVKSSKKVGKEMKIGAHDHFLMYADTEQERDDWVQALNSGAINKDDATAEAAAVKKAKNLADRDIKEALAAYARQDRMGRGLLTRELIVADMKRCGVTNNIAVATAKVLDWKRTGLVSLDKFIQGWKTGCLPKDEEDGQRCELAMHKLVTAIIEMGAEREKRGQPYTQVGRFVEYIKNKFDMSDDSAKEIGNQISQGKKSKIESLMYLRGVLEGIVPVTYDGAKEAEQFTDKYLDLVSPVPKREAGQSVPRDEFHKLLNGQNRSALSSDVCYMIFDAATTESQGNLRLSEFVAGAKVGLIPCEGTEQADEVDTRLSEVVKVFDEISGGAESIPTDTLEAALLQSYPPEQAKALVCSADVEGKGAVSKIEFVHLVFYFTLDPPQPVTAAASTTIPESDSSSAPASSQPLAGSNNDTATTAKPNDNKLQFADSALAAVEKLISGETTLLQLHIEAEQRQVEVKVSEHCQLEQVEATCGMGEPSYICINTGGMAEDGEHPDTAAIMFLTVLPGTSNNKVRMLHTLMRKVILNRLRMAGLEINVQKDVKENDGLSLPRLIEYKQSVTQE